MVSATAGTSARRTMFSRPKYLMLGSRTLMNFPSSDTPAKGHDRYALQDKASLSQYREGKAERRLQLSNQSRLPIPQARLQLLLGTCRQATAKRQDDMTGSVDKTQAPALQAHQH